MRHDLRFFPAMITATDHVDAWKQFMIHALRKGHKYEITSGSHAGGYRWSIDSAQAYIRYPESRPLAPIANPGLIPPVGKVTVNGEEMDEIEHYFHHYVYNPHGPQPGEHYNYSEWLYPLVNTAIDYYSEKGFGNAHAVLRVGDPFCFRDYFKPYDNETSRPTTPCLLGIDTKIVESNLGHSYHEKDDLQRHFLIFYVMYRCLPGDTPVFVKKDGVPQIMNMESIYAAQRDHSLQVVSVENQHDLRWADISQVSSSYRDDIVTVNIIGAAPLRVTADHRIPVLEEPYGEAVVVMKPAISLKAGDVVLESGSLEGLVNGSVDSFDLMEVFADLRDQEDLTIKDWTTEKPRFYPISKDLAYLMGLWLADGWYHQDETSTSLRVVVADTQAETEVRLKSWLQEEFSYTPTVEQRQGRRVLNIQVAFLTRLFQNLGFVDGAGEKELPSLAYSLKPELQAELLQGWFDGDSGVTMPRTLASQMCYLMKCVGQHSTFGIIEKPQKVFSPGDDRHIESKGCNSLQSFRNDGRGNKPSMWFGNTIKRQVKSVSLIQESGIVYDLAVADGSPLFFAGTTPVLVHNSWDLFGGFLTNMGGFQLLKEFMADMITMNSGKKVIAGPSIVTSKDLHLYSHHEEAAKAWLGMA